MHTTTPCRLEGDTNNDTNTQKRHKTTHIDYTTMHQDTQTTSPRLKTQTPHRLQRDNHAQAKQGHKDPQTTTRLKIGSYRHTDRPDSMNMID